MGDFLARMKQLFVAVGALSLVGCGNSSVVSSDETGIKLPEDQRRGYEADGVRIGMTRDQAFLALRANYPAEEISARERDPYILVQNKNVKTVITINHGRVIRIYIERDYPEGVREASILGLFEQKFGKPVKTFERQGRRYFIAGEATTNDGKILESCIYEPKGEATLRDTSNSSCGLSVGYYIGKDSETTGVVSRITLKMQDSAFSSDMSDAVRRADAAQDARDESAAVNAAAEVNSF